MNRAKVLNIVPMKPPAVQLAIATVQDIEYYKSNIKVHFDFLNNLENGSDEAGLKDHLGYLFSFAATLANQLDVLKEELPPEIALKGTLQNLIRSQLAPAFKNLMLYYRDGLSPDPSPPPNAPYHNDVEPTFSIMGATTTFKKLKDKGLSNDWITEDNATNWPDYVLHVENFLKYPSTKIYGSGVTVFERVNHIATHNLFNSIFDQFLKVYARTVSDAKLALEATLTKWDRHEPHYALFLAFLRLFEYAREESNTLTGRHLELYYREILQLKQKPAEPGHAHLLVELAKQSPTQLLEAGELFKAGKDDLGKEAFFSNDRDFVANQAKVVALKTVYQHGDEKVGLIAPTGKHVMSVWMQSAPYHLRESNWDLQGNALGDTVVSLIEDYAPGFKHSILHRQVLTPLDLERVYGLTEGHPYHAEIALDQIFFMRPVPGWARYHTPIENLYLCGSGTHPGGGVTGLPGYYAAKEILKNRSRGK
jgi:hypothetical protein